MKSHTFICSIVTLTFIVVQSCTSQKTKVDYLRAEVASQWNEKIIEIAVEEDNLLTLKGLRTISMVHLAMHDVLNTIVPKYERYAYKGEPTDVDPIVGVAYAAYFVSVDQYPDKKEELETLLHKWIAHLNGNEKTAMAKNLGEAVAKALLERRSNDGFDSEAEYTWHPMGPGVYAEFNEHSGTPEGFVFGSGWAVAQPFMLPKSNHFRAPPPPQINSIGYTVAFNEVKEMGSAKSTSRTADQSHLAMWWKEFSERSHNRLLRDLIIKENIELWDAVRTFALMNMAIYDGYINVFNNKFHYNHWRPYTAIRWAANDDNLDTEPDLEWNNLHKHTYPFPSYPSAHGTASTSAMTVLANTLGKGDNYAFTMTQKEVDSAGFFSGKMQMDPPIRSFNSFSEAGMEASMSRVYLGIHFRYDSEEGNKLGAKIGEYATDHFLKPIKEAY